MVLPTTPSVRSFPGGGSIRPKGTEVPTYKFARRSFLRAAGGSAVLLAPLLRSIETRAQGMTAPLRLLIIHHPLGAGPGLSTWRPNATATTTAFTLPLETAPFNSAAAPLQKYMVPVAQVLADGLPLDTARFLGGADQPVGVLARNAVQAKPAIDPKDAKRGHRGALGHGPCLDLG